MTWLIFVAWLGAAAIFALGYVFGALTAQGQARQPDRELEAWWKRCEEARRR